MTNIDTSSSLAAKKFMFERSFDDGLAPSASKPRRRQIFTEEEVESIKREAFETGKLAGQKAMMEDQAQYRNVLLSQIEQKMGHLIKDAAAHWQRQLTHLQEIALLITRKVLPAYATRHGLDEIQDIIAQVISEMAREPRLVVRVGEAQFDSISAGIKTLTEREAFQGKVVILAEPALGPADCRVEWADGGIERDMDALWKEIDRIIEERHSASSTQHPAKSADGEASSESLNAECRMPNANPQGDQT